MKWKRILFVALGALVMGILISMASPAFAAPADDEAVDRLLAALEGGWSGEGNSTPMGPMPFTLLFEREENGDLHSRTALNRETYVDLRFTRDATGRWILREEAGMEGLGVQGYGLVPVGAVDGRQRWVYETDPDFLHLDLGLEGEGSTMVLDVWLRGEPHVLFRLDRLPDEDLPAIAAELELAAGQTPEEGTSLAELVAALSDAGSSTPSAWVSGDACDEDPISRARCIVAREPDNGEARLELARRLGDAIQADPAAGPRYAFEMLTSLEKTIELEPGLAEAYHWLVGYYLNAPPIAGGSLEKAEETARRLAELDAAGAEALFRQIAEVKARRDAG